MRGLKKRLDGDLRPSHGHLLKRDIDLTPDELLQIRINRDGVLHELGRDPTWGAPPVYPRQSDDLSEWNALLSAGPYALHIFAPGETGGRDPDQLCGQAKIRVRLNRPCLGPANTSSLGTRSAHGP